VTGSFVKISFCNLAAEIDLFEINEALAAVALISSKLAYIDKEKINVKGMRS